MKLALGKVASALAWTFFSASTFGLLTAPAVWSAHMGGHMGGSHIGRAHIGGSHIGGSHYSGSHAGFRNNEHGMHVGPHRSFSGTEHARINGLHGEHGHEFGRHDNFRHDEMTRRDDWRGRSDRNFDRHVGREGFRHEELARHDDWRGRGERDGELRRGNHETHYLGSMDRDRRLKDRDTRSHEELSHNTFHPDHSDASQHSGSYFKVDQR